jgi:CubicO group peptidase (beta-lactamase class C family)
VEEESAFLFSLPIEDLKSTMQMRAHGIILTIGGVQAVALAGCAASGPDIQGFTPERLRRLDSVFVQQAIAHGAMPGVVMLVARNGSIVKFSADGYLDARKTKPMRRDAIFRLASMSKPLVAVAAMTLVESGQIKLTDPIAKWIPELRDMKVLVEASDSHGAVTRQTVPANRPITVQDLLRHTSGLCYADFAPSAELLAAYTKADLDGLETELSPDEFIHRLSEIPLAWQPGTRWQYGYSMDVLGVLLERATGQRLDRFLDAVLFKPLRMRHTGFQVKPEDLDRVAEPSDSSPNRVPKFERRLADDAGLRYRSAGGGLASTAEDYFRFLQMLLNGGELDHVRILSRKTVQLMTSDHIPGLDGPVPFAGPGYGFGLGFAIRRQDGVSPAPGSVGDYNWSGRYGTTFTVDPREKIVAIFMSQNPGRNDLRFLFKDLVYGALAD